MRVIPRASTLPVPGVHAAGQVVSLKMVLRPNVIETLNAELPEQIRVWTATRTNNKFNARTSCDSRRYEYLLPTYILAEMGETERALYDVDLTEELEQTLRSYATGGANLEREEEKGGSSANCGKRARADDDGDDEAGAVAEGDESEEEEEEGAQEGLPVCDDDEILDADGNFVPAAESTTDAPRGQPRAPGLKHFVNSKTTFRLAADQLERVRTMLRLYEGSHNFHNFTVRMPLSDPSSRRNMIKIEVVGQRRAMCAYFSHITHSHSLIVHGPVHVERHGMDLCPAARSVFHSAPDPQDDRHARHAHAHRWPSANHHQGVWCIQVSHSQGASARSTPTRARLSRLQPPHTRSASTGIPSRRAD